MQIPALRAALACSALLPAVAPVAAQTAATMLPVMTGSQLARGFDMGVESSTQRRDWATRDGNEFRLDFPARQAWATVFVTVGKPAPMGSRRGMDISAYRNLAIDLKGGPGGARVEVGIKSTSQLDDGGEKKVARSLGPAWQTHVFPLQGFMGNGLTDLRQIHVIAELVHEGPAAQTVYMKNIRLTR